MATNASKLHRHRRLSIRLVVMLFTSLMSVIILTGFSIIYHEMSSLNVIVSHHFIVPLSSERYQSTTMSTDNNLLHTFSNQEAFNNSENVNRFREYYHSRCLCSNGGEQKENIDCQQLVQRDRHLIWPEVSSDLLDAIHSSTSNTNYTTNGKRDYYSMLGNDTLWEDDSRIAKCKYVIVDLGSNRGDTLQGYMNVLLSSLYSPSSLSPTSPDMAGCANGSSSTSTRQEQKRRMQTTTSDQLSYRFDLQTLSLQKRTGDELMKRHERIHEHHQLDIESYLDLHIGLTKQDDGDPWMDFQIRQRLEQQQQQLTGNNGPHGSSNSLVARDVIFKRQMLRRDNNQRLVQNRPRPEAYCFYGIEGNPAFTRRLRGLEYLVMSTHHMGGYNPGLIDIQSSLRPLRHLHFFTETVASSKNGPTELYLDSVSSGAVGSSLLKSHKYANIGGKTATVQGRTLTWLLENVLDGFGRTGHNNNTYQSSGHLILKVDIEGGEYDVLKQLTQSDMLCEYTKNNRVDVAVEFHKWVIEDKKASNIHNDDACICTKSFFQSHFVSCSILFHVLATRRVCEAGESFL